MNGVTKMGGVKRDSLLDHIQEPILIDKKTGCVLYAPYFPMTTIYKKPEDYQQLLDEHSKAEIYIIENGVSEERWDEFARWKNSLNTEDLNRCNAICQRRRICLFDFWEELKAEWKRTNDWRSLRPDQFLQKTTFSNVDYNEWSW